MTTYKLDILDKEKKENLPYWLNPSQKQPETEAHKRIREKHRARWLADQKKSLHEFLARAWDESQHPRDEHGQWTDAGGEKAKK